METERGPETGPFKSLSPSATPPTPSHHIQDSWAEPAGLLGFGGGVGFSSVLSDFQKLRIKISLYFFLLLLLKIRLSIIS